MCWLCLWLKVLQSQKADQLWCVLQLDLTAGKDLEFLIQNLPVTHWLLLVLSMH